MGTHEISDIIYDEFFGGAFDLSKKDHNSLTSSYKKAMETMKIPQKFKVPKHIQDQYTQGIIGQPYSFGSFSYKIQKYPGDFDLRETLFVPVSNETIYDLERMIIDFTKKLTTTPDTFFVEAKMGFDEAFDITGLGFRDPNGVLHNWNSDEVLKKLDSLRDYKYIDNKFYDKAYMLASHDANYMGNNIQDWYDLEEIMREKRILRWSPPEIFQGYKVLQGGPKSTNYKRRVTIAEALRHKTMVKFDTFQYLDGRYVEVTNFFIIVYEDAQEKVRMLNLPDNFLDESNVISQLRQEARKFWENKLKYKPLKTVKRLWTLANITKDYNKNMNPFGLRNGNLESFTKIINSVASKANQINADIEAAVFVMNHTQGLTDKILHFLEIIKEKIGQLPNKFISTEVISELIEFLNKTIQKGNKKEIVICISSIKKKFQELINQYTVAYLKWFRLINMDHDLQI